MRRSLSCRKVFFCVTWTEKAVLVNLKEVSIMSEDARRKDEHLKDLKNLLTDRRSPQNCGPGDGFGQLRAASSRRDQGGKLCRAGELAPLLGQGILRLAASCVHGTVRSIGGTV